MKREYENKAESPAPEWVKITPIGNGYTVESHAGQIVSVTTVLEALSIARDVLEDR